MGEMPMPSAAAGRLSRCPLEAVRLRHGRVFGSPEPACRFLVQRALRAHSTRFQAIKRTYQPKKRYRKRVHGFMIKMRTPGGRRILRNRRRKGRHQLTP